MFPSLPSRCTLRARTGALLFAFALAAGACGGGNGPAPAPLQAAAIVAQPLSLAVATGQAATFTVVASGDGLAYQWRRDGKEIAGATGASYTLDKVQPGDDGASFTVVVRNRAGSVTSAAATLEVGAASGLSLLAGAPGGPGNLDGTDGRFAQPALIALGPAGVLYVADKLSTSSGDPGVRRTVDVATGRVATVKVEPLPGDLVAMVFDAAGNRYDLVATALYKTTPGGARSLLAGANQSGSLDGSGANARFGGATAMAIDGAGNLYVADGGNGTVRRVTPTGVVTTLAGTPGAKDRVDGIGSQARFWDLSRIAVDRAGNIWVIDVGNLRRITPSHVVTTLALKDAVDASEVYFISAGGIVADAAGNILVADNSYRCRIRRVGPDGAVSDFAGRAGATGSADGKGAAASFCVGGYLSQLGNPVIDAAGNLYVADTANATIRRVTPDAEVGTLAGRAAAPANVDGTGPAARFGLAAELIPPPRTFYEPAYELVTDAQGNVYVNESDRIRKVSPAGAVSTLPVPPGSAAGTVYYASGLAFGGSVLAVSDGIVSRIDANGVRRFVAGQAGVRGLADGPGAQASFYAPNRLIVDGLGNIYLKDVIYHNPATEPLGPQAITRKIAADGTVTTLSSADYDGQAWYADRSGTVWVTQYDGSIRRVEPDGRGGVVRSPPGGQGSRGLPAITRDAAGNVYVAEALGGVTANGSIPYVVRKLPRGGAGGAVQGSEIVVAGSPGWSGFRPSIGSGGGGSLGRVDALAAAPDGTLYLMSENALLKRVP